jgi:hypothetical protein
MTCGNPFGRAGAVALRLLLTTNVNAAMPDSGFLSPRPSQVFDLAFLYQATFMSAIGLSRRLSSADGSEMSRLDGEMVELSLLLPSRQAAALEMAAQEQGLTTGQMIRQLIRDCCDSFHAFGHLNPDRRPSVGPGA